MIIMGFLACLDAATQESRDAQVVTPPQGKYPALAEWLHIEGHCDVWFSVDERGHPFAVEPRCTHKIFCFDAKRAVSASKFAPKLVDGVPQVRFRAIYPMTYSMRGSGYSPKSDPRPSEPCESKAIS